MQNNSVNKGIFNFWVAEFRCRCQYTGMKILLDTSLVGLVKFSQKKSVVFYYLAGNIKF